MSAPLVIAAHGTRLPEGQAECRRLIARVAGLLPGVAVSGAYVELDSPTIPDAVAAALASGGSARPGLPDRPRAVVMPLMLGRGGHAIEDIPDGIEAGGGVIGRSVSYAAHLGPDARLRAVLHERIAACLDAPEGRWEASEVHVACLGRGCSVAEANADHVRLTRLLFEEGEFADVQPAFIQVAHPSLVEALERARLVGASRIVVVPNFLFPGRLERWMRRDAAAWAHGQAGVDVRVAGVIGDCDALAQVVIDRYHEALEVGA